MKKLLSLCLATTFLLVLWGCGDAPPQEPSMTSESITYRDFEAESEPSTFDVKYPQFSEYSKTVNQVIKKAAYPSLKDFPEEGKYNVVCSVEYDVQLQSKKTLSITFLGYKYWRGAAHPIHVYHTVNVNLQTGKEIRLSDVIDITKKNVLFLLDHNRNETTRD